METLHFIEALAQSQPVWVGLLMLFASGLIEYVFPPFPGDSITVVGAVFVALGVWPIHGVFGAVTAGSVCGALLAWRLGVWLRDSRDDDTWVQRWFSRPRVQRETDEIIARFSRRGSAYLLANRFVPAFRSLFFVAAGLAGIPASRVAVYSALSASLWNASLLGLGYAVGYNVETLASWVRQYTAAALAVLGVLVLAGMVGRLRSAKAGDNDSEEK